MLEEDTQDEETIERVAALDIGKAELVGCVRVPHEGKPGRRLQEMATYSTMSRSLLRDGRLAAPSGGDPGRDGGHLGLLETRRAPRGAVNRAEVKGLRRWSVAAGW